jgi:hypothetical protein
LIVTVYGSTTVGQIASRGTRTISIVCSLRLTRGVMERLRPDLERDEVQ